mmetsp:Transcript_860/g.2667  ORF Transcript_860/g.2667 Transcript_860/m.2667 type:complete len:231 (+) Transcript_860:241-933(+)|eukprot:CAMPEP_0206140500 /NCGR_PEP_ID=MMETSP1473-20131121/9604_1 /ASSEMBLY_ACC=CAM_ASM_001109 /TAXON_ID=1461547 /ORGANISM="Stichococcus sp, Strain RCC1054" /LENGTH=230 /DNA_ID=CAMNT_0053534659 /DNA_START=164 /DNA_END=856 /DNA_ORIENTATION=-
MLSDLQNLPSRGCLPAKGVVGICSKLPTYIAAHSTAPAQIITTDLTSPLVRSLNRPRAELKKPKTPAKQQGGGTSRKRKAATPASKQPNMAAAQKARGRAAAPEAPAAAPPAADNSGKEHGPHQTYTAAQLLKLQKKDLQDILRAYGATVTGKKGDLVARVQEVQLRRRDTVIELSEGSDDDCGGPAQAATASPASPMEADIGGTASGNGDDAGDSEEQNDEEEFEQEQI